MNHRIHIRQMQTSDLSFADEVRAAAGWNQTLTDWQRLLDCNPTGCFVAEVDGSLVGTATTTCYGPELAWIGMVLVAPASRRRGIGTALLRHCIHHLRGRGTPCIKLDATPLGRRLYDQLGFREEWTLVRWETDAVALPNLAADRRIRSLRPADWEAISRLDRPAFGAVRQPFLRVLAQHSVQALVGETAAGELAGFGMVRSGSLACYLGPIVAASPKIGLALVRALAFTASGQRLFWDIPDANTDAVAFARRSGFRPQRPLIRMFLGENSSPADPLRQFAIGAPETG